MDLGRLATLLLLLPHFVVVPVVKSWLNGWTTSRRLHEAVQLPCLFGCTAQDDLAHYISCLPLWKAIDHALPLHLPSTSPPHRLACSAFATIFDMIRLALAHWVYHAVKHSGDAVLCLSHAADHNNDAIDRLLASHTAAFVRYFDIGDLVSRFVQRSDG